MQQSDTGATRATTVPSETKKPWREPTLRRMKAGSAEVGTRNNNDGAFTTS